MAPPALPVDDVHERLVAIAVAGGTDPATAGRVSSHGLLDLLGVPRAGVFAPLPLRERVAVLEKRINPGGAARERHRPRAAHRGGTGDWPTRRRGRAGDARSRPSRRLTQQRPKLASPNPNAEPDHPGTEDIEAEASEAEPEPEPDPPDHPEPEPRYRRSRGRTRTGARPGPPERAGSPRSGSQRTESNARPSPSPSPSPNPSRRLEACDPGRRPRREPQALRRGPCSPPSKRCAARSSPCARRWRRFGSTWPAPRPTADGAPPPQPAHPPLDELALPPADPAPAPRRKRRALSVVLVVLIIVIVAALLAGGIVFAFVMGDDLTRAWPGLRPEVSVVF